MTSYKSLHPVSTAPPFDGSWLADLLAFHMGIWLQLHQLHNLKTNENLDLFKRYLARGVIFKVLFWNSMFCFSGWSVTNEVWHSNHRLTPWHLATSRPWRINYLHQCRHRLLSWSDVLSHSLRVSMTRFVRLHQGDHPSRGVEWTYP